MHKLAKAGIMREVKDYAYITLGLISYSLGWAAFLLPYQITTGGTTGISAIIYYSTGFPIQWSYFIISRSDDICYPDIRPAIQYKNDICYLYADFPALVVPTTGQQLCGSTGHDSRR